MTGKAISAAGPAPRRAFASLEFAIVAPIFFIMILGVFDASRALIIWGEAQYAAEAVAESAEKLSWSGNMTETNLTSTQMQNAMSTIYAEMPGLDLGLGTGTFPGPFSVTLSSIVYSPPCTAPIPTAPGCGPQTPYVYWSSYLTEGGPSLITSPQPGNPLLRPCGPLTEVAQWTYDKNELYEMLDPLLQKGSETVTLPPQVVADIQYTYTPIFSEFIGKVTFWASAAMPVPLGDLTSPITNLPNGTSGNPVDCTGIPGYN
jgi:hypothetical protein